MLAQDTHTGALYEVPEHLGAYGEHYDGLGFPGLGNLFKSVVGAIPGVGNIVRSLPGVGNILGGILGGGGGGAAPVPQIPGLSNIMSMIGGGGGGAPGIPGLQNIMGMLGGMLGGGGGGGLGGVPVSGLGFPGLLPFQLPGLLQRLMAGGGGLPFPPRPPMPFQFPFLRRPPGWIPSPVPFTGMRPRRTYMRCSVWPGPPALIPAFAAQAQAPGALPPGAVPGAPGTFGPGGGRHRRGRRRRR